MDKKTSIEVSNQFFEKRNKRTFHLLSLLSPRSWMTCFSSLNLFFQSSLSKREEGREFSSVSMFTSELGVIISSDKCYQDWKYNKSMGEMREASLWRKLRSTILIRERGWKWKISPRDDFFLPFSLSPSSSLVLITERGWTKSRSWISKIFRC